jgi:PEP-CTERM motif
MKKLVLAALSLGLAVGAYAQGQITFANISPAPVVTTNDTFGVYGTVNATGTAAKTAYHVALYWGTVGSTEAQLVSIATAGSYPVAGRFNGGVVTTPNGTAPGASAVFEVKGWTGAFNDYESAYAAAQTDHTIFVGATGIFTQTTSAGGTASPVNINFTGLTLSPVPEPSTIALAGLGAASLLLFRRRK